MGLFHSDMTCMSLFYVNYSFGWDQDSYSSKYSLLGEYEDRWNKGTWTTFSIKIKHSNEWLNALMTQLDWILVHKTRGPLTGLQQ